MNSNLQRKTFDVSAQKQRLIKAPNLKILEIINLTSNHRKRQKQNFIKVRANCDRWQATQDTPGHQLARHMSQPAVFQWVNKPSLKMPESPGSKLTSSWVYSGKISKNANAS